MKYTDTLIIGASAAGLAAAACLKKAGNDYMIIEQYDQVAKPWRNHYDRLHLHTNKKLSTLPYKKFAADVPLYPERLQVVKYMDNYQRAFDIKPIFNTAAQEIKREGNLWITKTSNGTFNSKHVIMATGPFGKARAINFKGMETFGGKIIHSQDYKTGKDFKGQHVLVVGFGNSACEIALDLFEQKAYPALSVRSAVNVLPRDILGIPILQLGLLTAPLPPRLADIMSAPLVNLLLGDISKLGLKKLPYGPLEQIQKDQRVPLLDIGTLKLIREGNCAVYDNIEHIAGKTVHFKAGQKEDFDTIVAAIGYNKNLGEGILQVEKSRFNDLDVKVDRQKFFGKDGLYFCGFWVSPTGQLREIALDAKKIARDIQKRNLSNP